MSLESRENIKEKKETYAKLSLHYSLNAQQFLKKKEYEKASEMMWGSMATILKAVAANKGVAINKHGNLFGFAEKLSKEMNNPEIYTAFSIASNLHTNFYESNLDEITLLKMIKKIARIIGSLMKNLQYCMLNRSFLYRTWL